MKEGLTNEQKMELAKLLYTKHNHTIKEIAEKIAISESELRYWIQDGKWDGLKKSLIITKDEQLKTLYEFLQIVNERIRQTNAKDIKDIDKAQKLTACIKNLEGDTSVAYAIDVAKDMIEFLKEDEPDAVLETTRRFNRYIRYKERKH